MRRLVRHLSNIVLPRLSRRRNRERCATHRTTLVSAQIASWIPFTHHSSSYPRPHSELRQCALRRVHASVGQAGSSNLAQSRPISPNLAQSDLLSSTYGHPRLAPHPHLSAGEVVLLVVLCAGAGAYILHLVAAHWATARAEARRPALSHTALSASASLSRPCDTWAVEVPRQLQQPHGSLASGDTLPDARLASTRLALVQSNARAEREMAEAPGAREGAGMRRSEIATAGLHCA